MLVDEHVWTFAFESDAYAHVIVERIAVESSILGAMVRWNELASVS